MISENENLRAMACGSADFRARRLAHFLCENRNLHSEAEFRLLVVRLGAMGDILHALPAVAALRRAHPSWDIGWVVEPRWRALLAAPAAVDRQAAAWADSKLGEADGECRRGGAIHIMPALSPAMPLVNRLHFAPAKEWGRNPFSRNTIRDIRALRRELRSCAYDAVLDLQGAVRSAVIARMAKARRIIGESIPREWAARWLFTERIETRGAHVIEQDVEVACAVAGAPLQPIPAPLPIDPEAERWCDALLAPGGCRPLALINPGAGWGAKRWPPERYAAVARGLAGRGMHVLVNAGPGEEALAETIVAGAAAIMVRASLDQLIALTRRIALCVAGDTGPLHLACALGRPVVGVYGPTDPSRNGPFATRATVLRSPMSQRDHSRRHAPEAGMLTIEPEDVLRSADALLAPEAAS
jgi:heptosyltransferase-1